MTKFAYNYSKNANTSHMPFMLNCGYYLCVLYKENINLRSKLKSVDKLSAKLKELMIICQKNLHHAQELQKQADNQGVKP